MQTFAIPESWGPAEKWNGFEGSIKWVDDAPKVPWWRKIMNWFR